MMPPSSGMTQGLADDAMPTDSPSSYPQAPWKLSGHALLSMWRVPLADLPMLPPGDARLVTLGRHAICATVWTAYESGGTLAYNELLFATAVRHAGLLAPACTVGPIWVDDEAAAAGGRQLWGIPKQMGHFVPLPADGTYASLVAEEQASMATGGTAVASVEFRPGLRLAVPLRLAVWTVQGGKAGLIRTRCALRGMARFGSASWRIAPDGPLRFLAGRQPMASAWLGDLSVQFGV
ncbi:acetoacetate decarboxylase family protein [Achromobacter sp. 77]|uniref:acetoacetate decarboxylase family protein n=1 Tax=Achromobacter TaxID=222 RepID=UPI0014692B56|nr:MULTISPECIES: acetoacetate decarboxylase family protein [Achromobacter]UDG73423.1 acetoacetate decarboxylase family protein [Achromobacter sp. 77]CAB3834569.1 hypothetical protein LMG26684_01249 [Achromobacter mucicolens]